MNKGLEASEELKLGNALTLDRKIELLGIIEKELKDCDTIKAKLTLVENKIKARRRECMDNVINTDEDSYIHDTNLTIVRELDWFADLLKEVLL